MGLKKIILNLAVQRMIMISFLLLLNPPVKAMPSRNWSDSLKKKLKSFETLHPDQFGLYVKDLETGEHLSWRADEKWYIASGVKFPIALAVLKQVDLGQLSLKTKIELTTDDYVDGAGITNKYKPGKKLSVQFLIQQMMIYSDNTASDLLIKTVGLENVQALIKETQIKGFSKMTSLADVRRKAFSYVNPKAKTLKGNDFLYIKAGGTEKEKIKRIHQILKTKPSLQNTGWKEAFSQYYSKSWNSATLIGYAKLLETTLRGQILKPDTLLFLLKTMAAAETGKNRIKAGFPHQWIFSHKTGTQYQRICDFGIAWNPESLSPNPVIITVCTRGFQTTEKAEKLMKKIGQAIFDSGIFNERTKIVAK